MALQDDLKAYISTNSDPALPKPGAPLVLLGEVHGENLTRSISRQLLGSGSFQYVASEWMLNAGPVRTGMSAYLRHHTLPPAHIPAGTGTSQRARTRAVRHMAPVLDELRSNPRIILHIGSRLSGGDRRDRRIAQHFLDEMADRKLRTSARGIALLGAAHAAAAPVFSDQIKTTRMILEGKGFRCASVFLLSHPYDKVAPLLASAAAISLNEISNSPSRVTIDLRKPGSPFFNVRHELGNSGKSLAEQFEYIVLAGSISDSHKY